MTLTYNFLAGTSTDYDTSLFFDYIKASNVYIGVGRNKPMWGFGTLIRIQHQDTLSFPSTVMEDDRLSGALAAGDGFHDGNSGGVAGTEDTCYIGYRQKETTGSWTFISTDTTDLGRLILENINDQWAFVSGLNSDYLEKHLITYGVEDYDYALFNWNQSTTSYAKIELHDTIVPNQLKRKVKLMYTTDDASSSPSTAFDSTIIGELYQHITLDGETYITGVNPDFITEGPGHIEQNSLQTAKFFLTDENGVILRDDVSYIERIEDTNEISIVFAYKYQLSGEAVQNSGRLKFVSQGPSNSLAVFYERFEDGQDTSDVTPSPIQLKYLKSVGFQNSLFNILGLAKVDTATELKFAKRIDTQATRDTVLAIPGVTVNDFITVDIDGDEDTAVEYATTLSATTAKNNAFDLVLIDKQESGGVGNSWTEEIYRELFVCVAPNDSAGSALTASYADHAAVFNTTTHNYDLGTVLYLARVKPVYRRFLQSAETFKIMF